MRVLGLPAVKVLVASLVGTVDDEGENVLDLEHRISSDLTADSNLDSRFLRNAMNASLDAAVLVLPSRKIWRWWRWS